MRNHVIQLKQPFNLKAIEKEHKMKTLGGEFVVFKNNRKFNRMVIKSVSLLNYKFNIL